MNGLEQACKSLRLKSADLQKQMNEVRNALEALQKICSHDWECTGSTSHEDCYECKICGKEKYV